MKKYLFLLLAIGLFSCSEDEPDTPMCIEDLLADFQVTADCVGDNLARWDFNGQVVYCFARGVCLSTSVADIYTSECELLCTLGGANGLVTCDGIPWQGNASNEVLIWVKEQ